MKEVRASERTPWHVPSIEEIDFLRSDSFFRTGGREVSDGQTALRSLSLHCSFVFRGFWTARSRTVFSGGDPRMGCEAVRSL